LQFLGFNLSFKSIISAAALAMAGSVVHAAPLFFQFTPRAFILATSTSDYLGGTYRVTATFDDSVFTRDGGSSFDEYALINDRHYAYALNSGSVEFAPDTRGGSSPVFTPLNADFVEGDIRIGIYNLRSEPGTYGRVGASIHLTFRNADADSFGSLTHVHQFVEDIVFANGSSVTRHPIETWVNEVDNRAIISPSASLLFGNPYPHKGQTDFSYEQRTSNRGSIGPLTIPFGPAPSGSVPTPASLMLLCLGLLGLWLRVKK
jgi:hypothetical protein